MRPTLRFTAVPRQDPRMGLHSCQGAHATRQRPGPRRVAWYARMNERAAILGCVSHGQLHDAERLEPDFAAAVADTMQALATASRVRILGRLRAGGQTVGDLADAVGMEPSAVSHQL